MTIRWLSLSHVGYEPPINVHQVTHLGKSLEVIRGVQNWPDRMAQCEATCPEHMCQCELRNYEQEAVRYHRHTRSDSRTCLWSGEKVFSPHQPEPAKTSGAANIEEAKRR